MEMNQDQQRFFIQRLGLEARDEALLMANIKEALKMKKIPTPSAMKWSDVSAILQGDIPLIHSPLQDPPDVSFSVFDDAVIQSIIKIMTNKFRRVSEMEVVVRVFLMVMIAVSEIEDGDIRVELQPSVRNHSTFTDFLICITRLGETLRFIEVKRTDISVDLTSESNETAQALREAQILLCSAKVSSPMPFLLTNGLVWSFGSAAKYSDTKIELTQVSNVFCDIATLHGWKTMIQHLRAFLCGTDPMHLPPAAAQPEN